MCKKMSVFDFAKRFRVEKSEAPKQWARGGLLILMTTPEKAALFSKKHIRPISEWKNQNDNMD